MQDIAPDIVIWEIDLMLMRISVHHNVFKAIAKSQRNVYIARTFYGGAQSASP